MEFLVFDVVFLMTEVCAHPQLAESATANPIGLSRGKLELLRPLFPMTVKVNSHVQTFRAPPTGASLGHPDVFPTELTEICFQYQIALV